MRGAVDGLVTSLRTSMPEFGAYMYYSIYLEKGRLTKAGAGRINKKRGAIIKGAGSARAHIRPAIFGNKAYITDYVRDFTQEHLKLAVERGLTTTPNQVAQMWTRVLNARPREHAVDSAPFRFGFHRRSIRGYGFPRASSEIKQQQDEARQAIRERLKRGSRPNKRKKP